MNLRQRDNLLSENNQLKKEKAELENKISDLIIMLDNKMSLMVDVLNKINDKPTTIQQVNGIIEKSESVRSDGPFFIPTPDSSSFKISAQAPEKKRRKSNIEDSLSKLSQLNEKP